ncbi:MAG: hypothetical protein AAFS10_11515, partial [Myxococcota bacterium]
MSTKIPVLKTFVRLVVVAALLLPGVVGLPTQVQAQDDLPEIDAMIRDSSRTMEPKKIDATPKEKTPITAPASKRLEVSVQWGLRQSATDPEAQDRSFVSFADHVEELGDPNRPLEASILLNEATAHARSSRTAQAQQRIEQARRIAPDMPEVAFAQAALHAQERPGSIFVWGRALNQAWEMAWEQPHTRASTQLDMLAAGGVSLAIIALLMVLLTLLRHLPLMASDMQRFVPRGVHHVQTGLAVVLVFLVPMLLLGSPLATLLVILVAGLAYMSWSERLVMVLVWCGLMGLPWAAHHTEVALQWPQSEAYNVHRAAFGPCDAQCRTALADALA